MLWAVQRGSGPELRGPGQAWTGSGQIPSMNPSEILRIVDAIHRDKNIDKEIVFEGIEAALITAAKRHYGEEEDIRVRINREDGSIQATHNGQPLNSEETVGRIGAQSARQVIIQKIREAERDSLIDEYQDQIGQMVTGLVQRYEAGTATVQLPNVEAILPRSETIPGESHHVGERVRATIFEVRRDRSRVKIVLSRIRPALVQRLFEQEIPEIAEGVIEIKSIAREPGYRSKVAVFSGDSKVDSVGACVGVRGNRIKNIVDELSGERIDIVRWSDDLKTLIPNALQPAEVDEVILCQMLGRAIVLVREDQLSLAIGRRGHNVRLASKLSGWDIDIMTQDELNAQLDKALANFCELDGVDEALAGRLVEEGYMTYDDLSVIEPDYLMQMGGLSEEQVDTIVSQAEERAMAAEALANEQKRLKREEDRLRREIEDQGARRGGREEGKHRGETRMDAEAGELDRILPDEHKAGEALGEVESHLLVGGDEESQASPETEPQEAEESQGNAIEMEDSESDGESS